MGIKIIIKHPFFIAQPPAKRCDKSAQRTIKVRSCFHPNNPRGKSTLYLDFIAAGNARLKIYADNQLSENILPLKAI